LEAKDSELILSPPRDFFLGWACFFAALLFKTNILQHLRKQEQLQREVDYVRAQNILKSMLQNGLITLPEFDKITKLNRKTFSPLLAEIMP
jgi:hypothetical protein